MSSFISRYSQLPLVLVIFILALSGCGNQDATSEEHLAEKPNVLFIFTDDQTYTTVRALGNDEIYTPHLDELVADGTTFTNAFNMGGWNGAICVASRAMIISGRYLWDAHRFKQKWRDGDPVALSQTWGHLMKKQGYKTYMSGKWHVDAPADQVFDLASNVKPGMPPHFFPNKEIRALRDDDGVMGDYDFTELMTPGYNRPLSPEDNSWSPADTAQGGFWTGGQHWSEVLRDDAIGFIDDASKQEDPFFMYLAFNAPHDHRQSPQSYLDMYPLENISLPENYLPEYPDKDSIGCDELLRDEALAPFPRTPYAIKTHIREYYAIISHLDDQIGAILDALEAKGMRENTYVFFTADHGLSVGRHGLIGKQSMFDHSMRVPLIIAGPGIPKNQRLIQDVYLQDIMATSLEVAGIEKPDYVYFNSLMGLATGTTTEGHYKEIYGAYRNVQRMIRKDNYKLIVYPKLNKTLLFDLENDPLEMNDLSGQAKYKGHTQKLFDDLLEKQEELRDTVNLSEVYSFNF